MPYSIAFVGYDGSGKTTLINNLKQLLKVKVVHMNNLSKRFYKHQHSTLWENFNYYEVVLRNKWLIYISKITPIIQDRCYICSLVYSNIEGFPGVAHKVKRHAFHPDVICLLEPVEEKVPKAGKFIVEYHKVLLSEGYICFDVKAYPFGQMTFWKCPEIYYSPAIEALVDFIGTIAWQPPSNL